MTLRSVFAAILGGAIIIGCISGLLFFGFEAETAPEASNPNPGAARTASELRAAEQLPIGSPSPLDTSAYDPLGSSAPPQSGLRIRVIDSAGEPIDGALVRVLSPRVAEIEVQNPGEWWAAVPQELVPDRDNPPLHEGLTTRGHYDLQQLKASQFFLEARHEDKSALLRVDRCEPGATVVLRVRRPRQIAIRVVDEFERPIEGARVKPSALFFPSEAKRTDAEGRALWTIDSKSPLSAHDTFQPMVFCDGPGLKVEVPVFPLAEEGLSEALITVHRARDLKVRIQSRQGEPLAHDWTLTVQTLGSSPAPDGRPAKLRRTRPWSFQGAETHLFGFAPESSIELILEGLGRLPVRQVVLIPAEPQVSEVTIIAGLALPVLRFQVLDLQGRVMADRSLLALVRYSDLDDTDLSPTGIDLSPQAIASNLPRFDEEIQSLSDRAITTDAAGRVELPVLPDRRIELTIVHAPPKTAVREFSIGPSGLRTFGPPPGGFKGSEARSIEALEPGAFRDLEPIALPDRRFVAGGLVTNAEGTPLAGATLRLFHKRESWSEDEGFGPRRSPYAAAQPIAEVQTDEAGRFEIHLAEPVGPYELEAGFEALISEPMTVSLQQADHHLIVLAMSGIAGAVQHPFGGHLRYNAGALARGRRRFSRPASAARVKGGSPFVIKNIPAGEYDVEIFINRLSVARIVGVTVRPGEVTQDPRLQDVRIGEPYVMDEVRVQTLDGQPIRDAEVAFHQVSLYAEDRYMARSYGQSVQTQADGVALLIREKGLELSLEIEAPGYLSKIIENPKAPLVVSLSAGGTLAVTLPGLATLAAEETDHPGFRLSLHAEQQAEREEAAARGLLRFRELGPKQPKTVSIRAGAESAVLKQIPPGNYRLMLSRLVGFNEVKAADGGRSAAPRGRVPAVADEVSDADAIFIFRIDFSESGQGLEERELPLTPEWRDRLRRKSKD